MNQQIKQLLKTVQNRQEKISEQQSAMDEEIKQIEKMIEQENKSWKDYWKVPEKTFKQYVDEYRKNAPLLYFVTLSDKPEFWSIEYKVGLLWNIVQSKEGDLQDFADILCVFGDYSFPHYQYTTTDMSEKVFKLLPQEFIDSFKDTYTL